MAAGVWQAAPGEILQPVRQLMAQGDSPAGWAGLGRAALAQRHSALPSSPALLEGGTAALAKGMGGGQSSPELIRANVCPWILSGSWEYSSRQAGWDGLPVTASAGTPEEPFICLAGRWILRWNGIHRDSSAEIKPVAELKASCL